MKIWPEAQRRKTELLKEHYGRERFKISMKIKPRATFGKYTGSIKPETSYLCVSDNTILKVESISKTKEVWMVNLRYTQASMKKDLTVSIVEYDFVKAIENKTFREI